jgi:hypothetical protein
MGNFWIAQSFIPTIDTLSKVELGIVSWGIGEPTPIHLYIRDNLTGINLVECFCIAPDSGYEYTYWPKFDFKDLNVTPGNTYYIVCEKTGHDRGYDMKIGCTYLDGSLYYSQNGNSWKKYFGGCDGGFVTWGKT